MNCIEEEKVMSSHCIPLPRRIVSLTVIFLVLLLLLPVNIARGAFPYETE